MCIWSLKFCFCSLVGQPPVHLKVPPNCFPERMSSVYTWQRYRTFWSECINKWMAFRNQCANYTAVFYFRKIICNEQTTWLICWPGHSGILMGLSEVTLPLPRVIRELCHTVKMIKNLPILTTSLIHFSLKAWENVLFELGRFQSLKELIHPNTYKVSWLRSMVMLENSKVDE